MGEGGQGSSLHAEKESFNTKLVCLSDVCLRLYPFYPSKLLTLKQDACTIFVLGLVLEFGLFEQAAGMAEKIDRNIRKDRNKMKN